MTIRLTYRIRVWIKPRSQKPEDREKDHLTVVQKRQVKSRKISSRISSGQSHVAFLRSRSRSRQRNSATIGLARASRRRIGRPLGGLGFSRPWNIAASFTRLSKRSSRTKN